MRGRDVADTLTELIRRLTQNLGKFAVYGQKLERSNKLTSIFSSTRSQKFRDFFSSQLITGLALTFIILIALTVRLPKIGESGLWKDEAIVGA